MFKSFAHTTISIRIWKVNLAYNRKEEYLLTFTHFHISVRVCSRGQTIFVSVMFIERKEQAIRI